MRKTARKSITENFKTIGINAILMTALMLGLTAVSGNEAKAANPEGWDKTFDKSDNVYHQKVNYRNRYGITIVADMYTPKDIDVNKKYPALVVGPPYGGVKEQGPGRYAQEMAERGYVAIAFDPSYNGESGGYPRQVSSPDIFVEDFSAGVDFLGTRPFVDRDRIGAIGICGSGAFSISAASVDTRIKAVATVSMYDMTRVKANGWKDSMTDEQRNAHLDKIAEQRYKQFMGGEVATQGLPEEIDENTDPITREFYDYYKTPRGQHPRSTTHFTLVSDASFMNFQLFNHIEDISRPILFIMGENAHSRYFTEDAYKMASEPKELYVVDGAGHVDLYDKMDVIPFDKIESFFNKNLK